MGNKCFKEKVVVIAKVFVQMAMDLSGRKKWGHNMLILLRKSCK